MDASNPTASGSAAIDPPPPASEPATVLKGVENVNMSDNARENGVEEVTMAAVDRFENGDWVDIQDPAHNTRWHV